MKLTKLILGLSLLAAALLVTTAHAQTDGPSAEARTCLIAKFERAQAVMADASNRSAELFKSRYPDKERWSHFFGQILRLDKWIDCRV